jgi:hypothetical protein
VNARLVTPLHGARWLAAGWGMFRAAPLGWLVLVFAYLMATMLLSVFPLLGPVAVSVLVPAFSVGFMAASRAAARRQAVELPMLFAGFRERLPQQLVLGVVYMLGFFGAIFGSSLLDDGALLKVLFSPARAQAEGGPDDALLPGPEEPPDHVEQGRLAAARRAEDADEIAAPHLEVDPLEHPHRLVLAAAGHREALDRHLDRRHLGVRRAGRRHRGHGHRSSPPSPAAQAKAGSSSSRRTATSRPSPTTPISTIPATTRS